MDYVYNNNKNNYSSISFKRYETVACVVYGKFYAMNMFIMKYNDFFYC